LGKIKTKNGTHKKRVVEKKIGKKMETKWKQNGNSKKN